MQSVISTAPEAPAGITHIPDLQTPLAQSGPVSQVVFGSGTLGWQSPPLHVPLWQSLASVQDEPAGEPEGVTTELSPPLAVEPPLPVEPPLDVEAPLDVELSPARLSPLAPPSLEP